MCFSDTGCLFSEKTGSKTELAEKPVTNKIFTFYKLITPSMFFGLHPEYINSKQMHIPFSNRA